VCSRANPHPALVDGMFVEDGISFSYKEERKRFFKGEEV